MIWESEGTNVEEYEPLRELDELERTRFASITAEAITAEAITAEAITAEARDDEADEFEDFDEEDFDDDFDDDFEEERDEEYEAENEEYPDDDFGTGPDVDEDLGVIEIEGDIEGDFDDAEPGVVEPPEGDEEAGEEDAPEPE